MNYKTTTLSLLLLIFTFNINAQVFEVRSFREDPSDISAIRHERTNVNDEKCAIIKVRSNLDGLLFDSNLGITGNPEYKDGEVWLYISPNERSLKLMRQGFITKDYSLPVRIESSKVYILELLGSTPDQNEGLQQIAAQWLAISSEPSGASVFIDDQLVGTTPFSRRYPEGTYTYRLELSRYHAETGRVELKDERQILEISLSPAFGSIEVSSQPEDGMSIYLNNENTGLTTPATLNEVPSGSHTIRVLDQWYQPQSGSVTVNDNQTTTISFEMQPVFANVIIHTDPPADIYLDGNRIGNRQHSSRMLAGIYEITASMDQHHTHRQQIRVEAGRDQEITLRPRPQTGSLDVTSTPFNARITLNGQDKGTTPATISDLLVGNYALTLSLDGYGTITKTITIKENETTDIHEVLPDDITNIDWLTDTETRVVEVFNPVTGKIWMDRNLGASRAAASSADAQAYGDLYQWGRAPDGHQKRNSGTTSTLSNSDTPEHSHFIIVGSHPYDWRSPQNDNLWQGVNGTNNPCPAGYRLPTHAELNAELRSWRSNDSTGAFASPLKLSVTGFRSRSNSSLNRVGFGGYYWSSTMDGINSRYLRFNRNNANMSSRSRAFGVSVRCIKD